jgi:hypothetical protein
VFSACASSFNASIFGIYSYSPHTKRPIIANILYTILLICMSLRYSTVGSVCWKPCP